MIATAGDREDGAQMCLLEHDHVVEAFAMD